MDILTSTQNNYINIPDLYTPPMLDNTQKYIETTKTIDSIDKETNKERDKETNKERDKETNKERDKERDKERTKERDKERTKETDTNDCSICLYPLDNNDKTIIIVTCCNNKFHTNCYLSWMALKKQCPLCRKSFENTSPNTPANTATNPNNSSQAQNNMSDTILNIHLDTPDIRHLERMRKVYLLCFAGFIGIMFYIRSS